MIAEFNSKLANDVLHRFPCLARKTNVWEVVFETLTIFDEQFTNLIRQHAPDGLRHDNEFMTSVIQYYTGAFELLTPDQRNDRNILQAAFSDPFALEWIPDAIQFRNPDLVAKNLLSFEERAREKLGGELGDVIAASVAASLWSRPDLPVIKPWFKAGGDFHSRFPSSVRENEECGFIVAEHSRFPWQFQSATTDALRGDKSFMTKAAKLNGNTFRYARGSLACDVEVATFAFSAPKGDEIVSYCTLFVELMVSAKIFSKWFTKHRRRRFLHMKGSPKVFCAECQP